MQYLLAAGLGFALGPLLGAPQALVLRRYATRTSRWILANALAWATGMPLVFAGAGHVPAEAGPGPIVALAALTCLTTGIVVGAVHGVVLVRMLPGRTG
jgi:hypothetical protein